jgi:glycine dehydrogenase subunit 1
VSYLPHTPQDRKAMLQVVGVGDVEELYQDLPPQLRLKRDLHLPPALGEEALERTLGELAARNATTRSHVCFLGGGATDRFLPSLVEEVISRAEFLTSYTPYQPEVSQGTLQAIYEFQTMVAELTGMEIAQASMYDGASAVAEAVSLAKAVTGRSKAVVLRSVDPASRGVLRTYGMGRGIQVVEVGDRGDGTADLSALEAAVDEDTCAVVVQDPNFFGYLEPCPEVAELAHRKGALAVAQVDPVALALISPPGEWGADVAVGEGQPLGIPLGFGGPYLGFFAARESLVRRLPGRLAGATYDRHGRRGFVLTFQTREQHIRREKATSNICTNQGLLALAACVYLASLGPQGLREVALRSLSAAHELARRIRTLPGYRLVSDAPFFDEFLVTAPVPSSRVQEVLLRHGILGGTDVGADYPERAGQLLFAVTERRTPQDLDRLVEALKEAAVREDPI